MYGFQDSQELTSNGGVFGLNTGARITKFEFNPNGGAQGAPGESIDLTVKVGDREYRKRFFPITKVFGRGDVGELTDPNTVEYKEAQSRAVSLLNGTLSDIVKCFASEDSIKEALSVPLNGFKGFAEVLERLVKSVPNWQEVPVDVFLGYQWKPSGDESRTYLELPKDVSQGSFLVRSLGEGFKKVEGDSLKYINEAGEIHPFKRSSWYMESPYANQTIIEETPSAMNAPTGGTNW